MSRASKFTLLGTSAFAAAMVVFVHTQQTAEKTVCSLQCSSRHCVPNLLTQFHLQAMHQGVIRDMEQQRVKRERQLDFDMQRELEAEYKKSQTVRNTIADIAEGQKGAAGGIPPVATAAAAAGR